MKKTFKLHARHHFESTLNPNLETTLENEWWGVKGKWVAACPNPLSFAEVKEGCLSFQHIWKWGFTLARISFFSTSCQCEWIWRTFVDTMPSHAQIRSDIIHFEYFVSKSLDSFQDLIWRSKSTLNANPTTVLECSYKGY